MPKDYNETLNLPKTDFPMRASLPKREPDMLKQWQELGLYHKMLERNSGKPRFILHDGPPFSNGYIHMGTVLNKCLKDFINRYKSMTGFQVPYVPGWDNHGMPIESAIIKQNSLDRKKMDIPEFRDACRDFAASYVDIQREQFIRLGILGDWYNPYLTMAPEFEAEEVKVFGQMYEKGYIYKGVRPVYWCAYDETALAEAEIEYEDQEVESLYVKFRVIDDGDKLSGLCDLSRLYFVIWTTTAWTLPGNLAISLGPDISYALAQAPDGDVFIVAKERLNSLKEITGIESFNILAELKGSEFEFMRALHPLYDRESLVILGDHVTLDTGTGCVHTAPGHGTEDFEVCKHYDEKKGTNIGVIVPVDERGHMNALSVQYDGMYYAKAVNAIISDLKESGALLASETIKHSYPHCWRCKNPILYRVTDQWFCSVEAFKEEAVAACADVRWIPSWGLERIISMIRERSDWCISRQRQWGLPIPVFYCSDCDTPLCTPGTIEHISRIFREQGSNAWFTMETNELMPPGQICPHCGCTHFYKLNDTLDCWFDSGSTHIASLEKDNPEDWPATMYLEGGDQFRGWFQSSLLTAVATRGRAPYQTVLTHGWTVDGEGKAMHKSLGNSILPEDIIPDYGAEILRLWASVSDYHLDVRCSENIFKQLSDMYLKIRNTARFLLGNLEGFDPDEPVPYEQLQPLDKWALDRLSRLIDKVLGGYEEYEFHTAIHAVHNFCVVEMSNLYLDVIKDRLYCEKSDSLQRRAAQTVIYAVLDSMVRLVAPVLAFTSNEIWLEMPHGRDANREHVMLNDMPAAKPEWRLDETSAEAWRLCLILRDDVNKALEAARGDKVIGKPLEAKVTLYFSDRESYEKIKDFDLPALFIVSEVLVEYASPAEGYGDSAGVKIEASSAEKCVRCWTHSHSVGQDPEHPELCARCAEAVSSN